VAQYVVVTVAASVTRIAAIYLAEAFGDGRKDGVVIFNLHLFGGFVDGNCVIVTITEGGGVLFKLEFVETTFFTPPPPPQYIKKSTYGGTRTSWANKSDNNNIHTYVPPTPTPTLVKG
jgi:hypothetical protein